MRRYISLPSAILLLLISLLLLSSLPVVTAISSAIHRRFVARLLHQDIAGMLAVLHEDPSHLLIDPGILDNKALRLALTGNHIELAHQLLLYATVDPNWAGGALLLEPVESGSTELVGLLLHDGRIDPTAYDCRCLSLAVENNRVEITRMLLEDPRMHRLPESDLGYLINVAASGGFLDIVKLLLLDQPNVHFENHVETICIQASHDGHWNVIRWILRDPRLDKNQHVYALDRALEYGVADVVQTYLSDPHFRLTTSIFNDCQRSQHPWLVDQLIDYFTRDYRARDPCIGERFTEFARRDTQLKWLLQDSKRRLTIKDTELKLLLSQDDLKLKSPHSDDDDDERQLIPGVSAESDNVRSTATQPIEARIQELWRLFEAKAVLIQRACRHFVTRPGGLLYLELLDKYKDIMLLSSNNAADQGDKGESGRGTQ